MTHYTKEELDLFRRYKPGKGPDRIAEIIHAWAEQKAEEGRKNLY